ncbi:SDR family oxidoreductase [Streptomyces ficellus]|uniref:SDR family oxidoreductase n=1 Tax=Streptomyces ficellus TaxID=1977088 RepID=A0ABT7Z6Q9_9ACTN|nr:SDR family oxidoreductase [Streptomyces ficellus]MDN3295179.1 SDR family oxidoreductase [Streptomyces ficellus]
MTVLLTGATGFLGSRLLLSLLTTRERVVVVLGRGADLRARVLAALEAAAGRGIDAPARSRLRCVRGDITQPWLGLAPSVYGRLAEETGAVWHCAGDIALTGERERLFRANVRGTANILELAALTPPYTPLVHMSTVAVAGGRRTGVVAEDDLSDAHGFETHYDASKYQAELLVRDWARRFGRTALVLRPSIVATGEPLPEGAPGHPLKVLGDMIDAVAHGGAPGIPAERRAGDTLRLRLPVPPGATFNIVQDTYATQAMLCVAHDSRYDHDSGVHTFHIVHPVNTTMSTITRAIEARYPGLRLACVERLPDPTPAERFIEAHLPGFLSYCHHTRGYDRSATLALTRHLAPPPPIDGDYLRGALGFRAAAGPVPATGIVSG